MNFSSALECLKRGEKVFRHGWNGKGWNGKGLSIELQRQDANGKMTVPYLFINHKNKTKRAPWLPLQTDLMAEDWYIVTK